MEYREFHLPKKGVNTLVILSQNQYLAQPSIFDQIEGEQGFLRREWPKVYQDPEYEYWMNNPQEPTTRFLIISDSIVIAHAAVFEKRIFNQSLRLLGLGGVLVRAEERGKGYGSYLTDAATAWIRSRDSDIGALICNPSLIAFYERFYWEQLPNQSRIRYGVTEETAHSIREITMAIRISEGAKNSKEIESGLLYLGKPF